MLALFRSDDPAYQPTHSSGPLQIEDGAPLVPEEVYAGGLSIAIPRWQDWAKGAKEKLDRMLAEQAA
jgi:hypothetical protein